MDDLGRVARTADDLRYRNPLETPRETALELATEDGAPPPEPLPLPHSYREILALFEQNGDGPRAWDVCRTLGTEPRHTEGMRAKLKRLVNRDIPAEPEPSLFTLTQPTPDTPETDSS
jgi:hypothetical protein